MANEHMGVWAFGKSTPGWYLAKSIWSKSYALHLQELGYVVAKSPYTEKPDFAPADAPRIVSGAA